MFDIHGDFVNINVQQSNYPLKRTYRSKLQEVTSDFLVAKFPRDIILEDFIVPGSKKSVDFFIPNRNIVVEVQGKQHDEHVGFFHGDKKVSNKFAKQKISDMLKCQWCESNGFNMIEVRTEEDLENI